MKIEGNVQRVEHFSAQALKVTVQLEIAKVPSLDGLTILVPREEAHKFMPPARVVMTVTAYPEVE